MTTIVSADDWGLIFDVDGIIANTEPLAMEATQTVFNDFNGSQIARADMLAYMGSTAHTYFSALCKEYAPEANVEALIAEHNTILLREFERARNLIFPGVRALLERASGDPTCRIGLATGSGRTRSEATLAACDLRIESSLSWITGDDIVHAKPHPEIYLKVADALGLAPKRCVAIEDSVAGVSSARIAGMRCLAVTNTFSPDSLAEADMIVPTLETVTLHTLRSLV